ncbi:MAG: nuclear transport factor 2 family protein [Planctomycetota bacterium]|jgi:hypothetical protein
MSIREIAQKFQEACDDGLGWDVCREWCHDDATFACQCDALKEIKTLADYTGWLASLFGPMPENRWEMQSVGVDEERGVVSLYAVFHGTHTADGGPVPPTGKTTATDYVYVLSFDGDRIRHMTKIWNDLYALRELGWA